MQCKWTILLSALWNMKYRMSWFTFACHFLSMYVGIAHTQSVVVYATNTLIYIRMGFQPYSPIAFSHRYLSQTAAVAGDSKWKQSPPQRAPHRLPSLQKRKRQRRTILISMTSKEKARVTKRSIERTKRQPVQPKETLALLLDPSWKFVLCVHPCCAVQRKKKSYA